MRARWLICLLMFALAFPGLAQDRRGGSLDRVLPHVRQSVPGTFYDAEGPFFGPDGQASYRLKWMTPDGRIIWFSVDAQNGRVLGNVPSGSSRGRPRDDGDRGSGWGSSPRNNWQDNGRGGWGDRDGQGGWGDRDNRDGWGTRNGGRSGWGDRGGDRGGDQGDQGGRWGGRGGNSGDWGNRNNQGGGWGDRGSRGGQGGWGDRDRGGNQGGRGGNWGDRGGNQGKHDNPGGWGGRGGGRGNDDRGGGGRHRPGG
jgi:hypothetical protein